MRKTREELEEQIGRYRALYWGATDEVTRTALRETLKMLEHQLEAFDAAAIAATQPKPTESPSR